MIRTFIEVPNFTRDWKRIGLTEEDLLVLQMLLLENPERGDLIQGTGGIRKIRVSTNNNRGKSAGARVCYYDATAKETIWLLFVYPKNVQENLTDEEKKILREYVKQLKK